MSPRSWWRLPLDRLLRAAPLLLLSCGGGGGAPGTSASAPITIERETLNIAAGQEERITADRLIIKKDAVIDGNLIVIPAARPASDTFELRVEDGDLAVRGEIRMRAPESTNAAAALAGSARRVRALDVADATAPSQRNLLIQAPRGIVSFGFEAGLLAGDGVDGVDLIQAEPASARGVDGGPGGDITVRARMIRLELRESGDVPFTSALFFLGSGGDGGGVVIDDAAFPPAMPERLDFFGGSGGRSGRLTFEGEIVTDPPDTAVRLVLPSASAGGRGGDVEWVVGDGHAFENLRIVALQAGHGGNGAGGGGAGGSVVYRSGKTMNARSAARTTDVGAIAGDGGHADADYLNGGERSPVLFFYTADVNGGRGGSLQVSGNRGADGLTSPAERRQGVSGGAVRTLYGNGGRVTSTRVYPAGRGGDGGGMSDAGESPGGDYFVSAAAGGDGASGCDTQSSGGNGGDAGLVFVRLGDGGDGPTPGNGGALNYDHVYFPAPGRGGAGMPPGSNGAESATEFQLGAGGRSIDDSSIVGANTVVSGSRVSGLAPEPEECSAGGEEESSWSEELRQENFVDGALSFGSVSTTSCSPTGQVATDPVRGGSFAVARCQSSNSYTYTDGRSGRTDTSADCLIPEQNIGQSTTQVTITDPNTGTTSNTSTGQSGCTPYRGFGTRGRYGGLPVCAIDPSTGARTLVAPDGGTYVWSSTTSSGRQVLTNTYRCSNCAAPRNCRCEATSLAPICE